MAENEAKPVQHQPEKTQTSHSPARSSSETRSLWHNLSCFCFGTGATNRAPNTPSKTDARGGESGGKESDIPAVDMKFLRCEVLEYQDSPIHPRSSLPNDDGVEIACLKGGTIERPSSVINESDNGNVHNSNDSLESIDQMNSLNNDEEAPTEKSVTSHDCSGDVHISSGTHTVDESVSFSNNENCVSTVQLSDAHEPSKSAIQNIEESLQSLPNTSIENKGAFHIHDMSNLNDSRGSFKKPNDTGEETNSLPSTGRQSTELVDGNLQQPDSLPNDFHCISTVVPLVSLSNDHTSNLHIANGEQLDKLENDQASILQEVMDEHTSNPVKLEDKSSSLENSSSSIIPSIVHYSVHSVENARYSVGGPPQADHSNDDRYFAYVCKAEGLQAFGVFDGHDGSNASQFACSYMKQYFENNFMKQIRNGDKVDEILERLFCQAEDGFFGTMEKTLDEKNHISQQLQGLTSYEAYIGYPHLVERLQDIEPSISGGTTAVVAVLFEDMLYVANTGDSRAVLVQQLNDAERTLVGEQLSVDHTVDNEAELKRLQDLGLDPAVLKKNGRLGSQENTRCIGDYLIKGGYKELDSISHASDSPGIAVPFVKKMKITGNFSYLLLMTDGVYKSIESLHEKQETIGLMKDIVSRLENVKSDSSSHTKNVSEHILLTLREDHHMTYQKSAENDARSTLAVQCRKRDDMTLIICEFGNSMNLGKEVSTPHRVQPPPHVYVPVPAPRSLYSSFSVENARYSPDGRLSSDHPNDDRHFILDEDGFKVFGVFDGHDGSNASQFACHYIEQYFKNTFITEVNGGREVEKIIEEVFNKTEGAFFRNMKSALEAKEQISLQLKGLTSYEAYIRYPHLVERLQEIEPSITGGTTAVIAVLIDEVLYVANTGDSRALLLQQVNDTEGTLVGEQLTVDHTVDNEEELLRLSALGLDSEQLKQAGRLGSQENTRCIGDYIIKSGYKGMEAISHASEQPAIAVPSIRRIELIAGFQYLILMTDGVYKSVENMVTDSSPDSTIQAIISLLTAAKQDSHGSFKKISEVMLRELETSHCKTYKENAQVDIQSPLAVQCRKRDDMTLIVYKFGKI